MYHGIRRSTDRWWTYWWWIYAFVSDTWPCFQSYNFSTSWFIALRSIELRDKNSMPKFLRCWGEIPRWTSFSGARPGHLLHLARFTVIILVLSRLRWSGEWQPILPKSPTQKRPHRKANNIIVYTHVSPNAQISLCIHFLIQSHPAYQFAATLRLRLWFMLLGLLPSALWYSNAAILLQMKCDTHKNYMKQTKKCGFIRRAYPSPHFSLSLSLSIS